MKPNGKKQKTVRDLIYVGPVGLETAWLKKRMNTDKPWPYTIDESHEPRISVGDEVLVDEGDTTLKDGSVYVVQHGKTSVAMPSQLVRKLKEKVAGRVVFSEHTWA